MGCGLSSPLGSGQVATLLAEKEELAATIKRLEAEAEVMRNKLNDREKREGAQQPVQARSAKIPSVGDHVISHHQRHSYYEARVVQFDAKAREFEVAWDDGDKTGTRQQYEQVCLNVPPEEDDVAVSTIVYFPQGKYRFEGEQQRDRYHEVRGARVHLVPRCALNLTRPPPPMRGAHCPRSTCVGRTQIRLGHAHFPMRGAHCPRFTCARARTLQGRITKVERHPVTGVKTYVGMHTRSELDGKWCTYGGYEQTFRCALSQLRVCANLLDLIESDGASGGGGGGGGATAGGASDCQVYVSYCLKDVETARRFGSDRAADPTGLAAHFAQLGWKVYFDPRGGEQAERNLAAMSSAKVIVACLSDAYAAETNTRQELQYAKKTLKRPVVPIIVGDSSESWAFMNTLVGLLIAGDLYIDLRARSKHADKLKEAVHTLQEIIMEQDPAAAPIAGARPVGPADGRDGPRDIFVSYCWVRRTRCARPGARPRPLARVAILATG
jgi:hypothetical protein